MADRRRQGSVVLKKGGDLCLVNVKCLIGVQTAVYQREIPRVRHYAHVGGTQEISEGSKGGQCQDEVSDGPLVNDQYAGTT